MWVSTFVQDGRSNHTRLLLHPSELSRAQNKPRLMFDTSAINWLTDDKDRALLEAGIRCAYWFRLNGDTFGELFATPEPTRRKTLREVCSRLASAGDCMLPHDEILRALMTQHAKGNRFHWATVPARCKEYEEEIARGEFVDDKVSKEQKDFANEVKAGFTDIFECASPRFQQILRRGGAASLGCSELVNALRVDGGAFWSISVGLYRKATEITLDEGTARHFVDDCPPFRALLMALCLAQHQRCIAPPASKKAKKRLPNAFDLYMSLYLPYCDLFVTADAGQQMALGDVASLAQLTTEIQHYREFRAKLLSPLANG